MLTRESAHFQTQTSARMLALAAELPSSSPSQQVVEGLAGSCLRRSLVEACAGHTPNAPLPPVVTHFAVRAASIVELLLLASLLPEDAGSGITLDRAAVIGLAAKEAAELGQTVSETVAATAADITPTTGQLLRLACVLGGQVAGRSAADLDVLARFGVDLGVAVQILDDAVDPELAGAYFRRALAQLDELGDEQVRERIVVVARAEWIQLQ